MSKKGNGEIFDPQFHAFINSDEFVHHLNHDEQRYLTSFLCTFFGKHNVPVSEGLRMSTEKNGKAVFAQHPELITLFILIYDQEIELRY